MQRLDSRRTFLSAIALMAMPGIVGARPRIRPARIVTSGTLFVVCSETNSVAIVDLARGSHVRTVAVGASPTNVVFSRKTRRLFVSNFGANSISVIDRDSSNVIAAFDSTSGPGAMTVDEDSNRLYVCNVLSGTVRAIDLTSGTTVGTVTVGTHPNSIVGDFHNKRFFVVNSGSGTISIVEVRGQGLSATSFAVDPAADSIVLSHSGASAYISNTAAGTISVFDLSERRITATIVGLRQPRAIAVVSDRRMYVAESGSPTIAVVDIDGSAVISRISLSAVPMALRTNAANDRLFAVGYQAGSVSVVETTTGNVTRMLVGFGKPRDLAIDG